MSQKMCIEELHHQFVQPFHMQSMQTELASTSEVSQSLININIYLL